LLLMEGLRQRGQRVELAAPAGSPLAVKAGKKGFQLYPLPAGGSVIASAVQLRGLRSRGYDVVHTHDAAALTAIWLAGLHTKSRLVAARRLAHPLSKFPWAMARFRAAHRVIAISEFVRQSVLASGVAPAQVEVVYDGVPAEAPAGSGEKRVLKRLWGCSGTTALIGCVGYLLPEKGQEILVRAMPQILQKAPEVRLVLAGDGPCRKQLVRLAEDLGISTAVVFAGHVDDVSQVYRALDVFVFPSLAEPLGSSLLAAMAYGLPVVAASGGAVPEVISSGQNGLLVEAGNAGALAEAVVRLLVDSELAARLASAARATIENRFTADRMVEETLRIYVSA